MDEQISQNLRTYSRQLMTQLKDKEKELTDLRRRFSKLQGRFAQLDYAFKKNLQLHQQQMIQICDLRLSEKELRKVERDRWKKFRELEAQLLQVTNEKEATKIDLVYWKQTVIDQKIFYDGKFEECLRGCRLRMEADANVHQRTLRETKNLTAKHIQELADRCKVNEAESEAIRKKAIVLQGDVDVLKHRVEELACLIENAPGMGENLQAIDSCIVKVMRSFSTPHGDYDDRMKELHQELLRRTSPAVKPEGDYLSDYETLKSQNLVLREVVKKLKNELGKVQKNESMISKPQAGDLRNELVELNSRNKKLCNLVAERDAELRKLEIESRESIAKLEMSLGLMKSKETERQTNFSKANNDPIDCIAAVEMSEEFASYFEGRERRDFDDDKSQEVYWGLGKGRVKKFKDQATRDTVKSLELNLESLNSEQSCGKNNVTLKDKQKVEDNIENDFHAGKNTDPKLSQGLLEPIESHLNSVQYKEYTISLSKNHNLKIRHPMARGSGEKLFRFSSVYSEKKYQSTPVDEAVLYFDYGNDELVRLESRITNCAVQTTPIPTANVFTQTTPSQKTFITQPNAGVKILHSERQAIERSLRNLEKTVSEAGEETLGLARSLIINTSKFPPSEEFFDCIRFLSQSGAT